MFVVIRQLPEIEDDTFMQEYEQERLAINASPQVQYSAVNRLKEEYLRRLYKQQSEGLSADSGYLSFCQKNSDWLI